LLVCCCRQQALSRKTARNQQGLSRKSASGTLKSVVFVSGKNDKKEESAGSADDRFSSKKILDGINLSQSVYRQANFLSGQPHICIVNNISKTSREKNEFKSLP
jgi:hypothetical protein